MSGWAMTEQWQTSVGIRGEKYVYYTAMSAPAMMNGMLNLNLIAQGPSDGLNAYRSLNHHSLLCKAVHRHVPLRNYK